MKNFKKNFKNNMKNENGAVMVFVAVLMVILLAFASLGVEFGLAYYQRERLQTACDAAALAGAQYLPNTVQAEKSAKEYFYANYNGEATVDVGFTNIGSGGEETITVSAETGVATTLGSAVGTKKLNVNVLASAVSVTTTTTEETNEGGGEFPYLLYAQSSSGTLQAGHQYFEIEGAIHSNGSVQDSPNGGYVKQLSYGEGLSLGGGSYIRLGKSNYMIKKLESWGLAWVDGTINLNTIKADLDKYYLIPATIYDANGNQVWYIQSLDWLNNTELYTSADKATRERAFAVPLSSCIDSVLRKEKFLDASDAPVKMIKELTEKAEDKISDVKKDAQQKFNAIKGSSVSKTNDNKYFSTSHSDSGIMVVSNSGQYYSNAKGNVTQNNSIIAYKGSGVQFMNLQPSEKSTYNVKNIVYYSDSNSGDNGIEVKNMKITTGGIYSNTSMKVRNDGKKSTDFVVNGNIYADGDLYLYHITVNGNVYCTGNLSSEGCDINGFIGANKKIRFQGEKPDVCSYSATNPMALSIYSVNGDVEFIAGDDAVEQQYVAGIVLAPNGQILINSNMRFYGNMIGNTISNNTSKMYAYPLSALDGFTSDNILTVSGSGGTGGGTSVTSEKKVFLVE